MNNADIENFEEQLKRIQLRKPSDKFFAAIENAMNAEAETARENADEHEIEEIERRLKSLKPVEPSEKFFAAVAAALEDESAGKGVAIQFPQRERRGLASRFSRWISAAAAVGIGAAGILLWQNSGSSSLTQSPAGTQIAASGNAVPATTTNRRRELEDIVADADSALIKSAGAKLDDLVAHEAEHNTPHYELVSSENSIYAVEEMPIEEKQDGSIVRPVRYIYTNTQRWKDPNTQKTCVEHRPFEEVVPTVLAVY
ncbi:MAG: hypothetical protein LUD39_07185 [Opitutae bacterium]|nr:hypothetical protein [Opitutae bacterium]